jgi:hypothetical protein
MWSQAAGGPIGSNAHYGRTLSGDATAGPLLQEIHTRPKGQASNCACLRRHLLESRMREIRTSGSTRGGAMLNAPPTLLALKPHRSRDRKGAFFTADTLRRRERRENQERQNLKARLSRVNGDSSGIRLRLVHPSAARTSSSSLVFASLRLSLRPCVSAGNASLCLLPSSPSRTINLPAAHIFPSPAEKVSVRQDAGAQI